jgi:phage terminase large subunit
VEEAATVTKRSWDILGPTIRKDDSEIWVTFNPDLDTDETWVRFIENTPEDALVLECSYHNNPWFPKVLERERQEFLKAVELGIREQEEYDNIWEGKTKSSVEGAIYNKQIAAMIQDGRYTSVPHNPRLYTHTVWDLGYNGMSIGFVQKSASTVNIIDHVNVSGYTYEDCAGLIRQKVRDRGYRIAIDGQTGGKAWLPHDGKQTRPDKGKSPINQLKDLGLDVDDEGIPNLGIDARIEAGRVMFPRVWIDKENCTDLFNSLRRYARKIMPETGQVGGIKKDGNDHDGDMYTYIGVIEDELVNESIDFKPLQYDNTGIV